MNKETQLKTAISQFSPERKQELASLIAKLSQNQKGVLESVISKGRYNSQNSGWSFSSPAMTLRVCNSLVKLGLLQVSEEIQNYETSYIFTPADDAFATLQAERQFDPIRIEQILAELQA